MVQQLSKRWMIEVALLGLGGTTSLSLPGLAQPSVNPLMLSQSSPGPVLSSLPTPSRNFYSLTTSPNELVDEVWQIVDRTYVDGTFNQKDWQVVRKQYTSRSYNSLEEAYQAINEMLKLLGDPLTRFLDPLAFKNLQVDSSRVGIGLQLTHDTNNPQKIKIIAPIEDGPAWNAGILAGDMLTKIDDKSTDEIGVDAAVALLRGKPGSFVTVTILRDGKPLEFRVQRVTFEVRPVRYHLQETKGGKVGYIRLVQFSAEASTEMRTAIKQLEQQNVNGYILDLRSNSGGLLFTGIEIVCMWLNQGLIVDIIDRNGKERESANNRALTNQPLVVLVDSGSAAASEILAAALQENQRAALVGTHTAGSNSIQSVRPLKGGSGLAVTVAKWLTPKGRDINKVGLEPDVMFKPTEAQQRQLTAQRGKLGSSTDAHYIKALETLNQRVRAAN
ncbi:MAG TPA: PDZ domain-containing protein [Leptolyngbyaceae cyanobacterium M33_DOE_097]|uniref:PDZ domain-containing protein n=1 Tax=Oscillatoriales cyanobacterium SpSt-418 TaxID=2282169 RepID=A0A7C3KDL5_9CYAN|nr:PDZ domain-containing protein [Leptolyngbyaceae cyanobacterium M33_DOE_097]